MISEDGDRVRSPLQILFPFSKSKDNSKEFPIIDVVVALGHVMFSASFTLKPLKLSS